MRYAPSQSGSRVTITGTSFIQTARSLCQAALVGCPSCTSYTAPATVLSNTTAVCTLPPIVARTVSAQTGQFFPGPPNAGTETLGVGQTTDRQVKFSQDGQIYSSDYATITMYASHAVSSISPASMSRSQNAIVTITGAGFRTSSPDLTILRLGSKGVACTVVSSTQLTCNYTAPSVGAAMVVEVSMNGGTDFEGHNSVFLLVLAPAPLPLSATFQPAFTAIDVVWSDPATDRAGFRNVVNGSQYCGTDPSRCLSSPCPCALTFMVS